MENKFYNAFDFEPLDAATRAREGEYRTVFEINRDRIIHTSAFRRLQSKTQVFLSGEYDFYRTRLTHSIEVSQIGRGICQRLRRCSGFFGDDYFIDPDLVEAACLAHDLGHPPFGHSGERTIHRLMKPWGGFEGNAQTLRMLTETIFAGSHAGMNPCRALLDATLKYKTLHRELSDPPNHFLYDTQQRYLDFVHGNQEFPLELPPGPARDGFRSIECQIMDWADDTAYSLNDIADGINAGFITLESLNRWAEQQTFTVEAAASVDRLLEGIKKQTVENRLRSRIAAFIAAARIEPDANFMCHESHRYRFRLVIGDEARDESRLYKKIALHLVFRSRQLQQLEHKSDTLLTRLFHTLAETYITGTAVTRFRLLPESDERQIEKAEDEGTRARLVCDAVTRMTDGAATRMCRRLFDADFQSIVDLG
ncbi:MAG TPA: dNTP triphosphohydrolase [Verrucomicrobiales bacterium]|nr:dNTP triphosphohydrolase [Verrucomicrobiales bacterium]